MEILNNHAELSKQFEELCQTRRDEILADMVNTDNDYDTLRRKRADASMILRDTLGEDFELLELYSESIYAQECYELDTIYRQGFLDALDVLHSQGLL